MFPVSATDLGACLLDPACFPSTTRDTMITLLGGIARFTAADVAAALAALFPPAPPPSLKVTALSATAQAGGPGMQAWILDDAGSLWTTVQPSPGAAWGPWQGPGFASQPGALTQIAAGLQNTGCAMLGALDKCGMVWCVRQVSPGGAWGAWEGPNVGGQPHAFSALVASQQRGNRGIEFWAMGDDGQVWTLYELTAGGPWSSWEGPGFKGQTVPLKRIAAAEQNNGNVLFCGLDAGGVVYTIGQSWAGGDWGGWSANPFQTPPPPFVELAAVEQNGPMGAQLLGLTDDGTLWSIVQTSPGGAWPAGWEKIPPAQPGAMALVAAAGQGNGNVGIWTLDRGGALWSIGQLQPGVDSWGPWTEPPMPG